VGDKGSQDSLLGFVAYNNLEVEIEVLKISFLLNSITKIREYLLILVECYWDQSWVS